MSGCGRRHIEEAAISSQCGAFSRVPQDVEEAGCRRHHNQPQNVSGGGLDGGCGLDGGGGLDGGCRV